MCPMTTTITDNTPPGPTTPPGAPSPRRLATVETIVDLAPIPGADNIVRARVRGWDLVTRRGEFAVGDLCVYFEVDTMVEVADPRFEFLTPRGVRTDVDGAYGHVLRTVKLRGQYSQGLALPLSQFPELAGTTPGTDVTDVLPVIKWEPPVPAEISGQVRGGLPGWISKTDEERIQNIGQILTADVSDWEATEKIDGTSMTAYVDPSGDVEGVAGRTWDLVESDKSTLWRLARELDLHGLLSHQYPGLRAAVQGEAFGEGIQANPLRIRGQRFAAFNLLVDGQVVPRAQWPDWLLGLSVPVHTDLGYPATVEQALGDVEKLTSLVTAGRPAEGIVWRARHVTSVTCSDGSVLRASWKVISNRYLLKGDR